jgi:hypothetical protein
MRGDDIIHPIFLNCCRLSVDKFWENIFEDLAYGVTPYGSYIQNNAINYKSRAGVTVSVIIYNDNAELTYSNVYDMFFNTMKISSPEQRINAQTTFKAIEDECATNRESWGDIKKKSTKEILIDMFVIRMQNLNNIPLQEIKRLRSRISSAMLFKVIDGSDMIMVDGEIESINGITFVDKEIIYSFDLTESGDATVNNATTEPKTIYMAELWGKYIEVLKAKIE